MLMLHPYSRTDSVDYYYAGIANKIYGILCADEVCKRINDKDDVRYISLCLSAWFEDIISNTGIWTTFTAECRRRYGSWLPSYSLDENYYPDEINREDLLFLLEHHMQVSCADWKVGTDAGHVDLNRLAEKIYAVFDEAYETAPENKRLWRFLHPSGEQAADFKTYCDVLEWFHYKCYFNIENIEELEQECCELYKSGRIADENMDIMFYGLHRELMLAGRRNLLSLTSNEWLALWAEHNDGQKEWRKAGVSKKAYFLFIAEDEDFFYLRILGSDDGEEFKAVKSLFNLNSIKDRVPCHSVFFCTLLRYGDTWRQLGVLFFYDLTEEIEANARKWLAEMVTVEKS